MSDRAPMTRLVTHEVTNQPPPLENYAAFDLDAALKEAFRREGPGWAEAALQVLGAKIGSEEVIRWGDSANRFPPVLRAFDRYGHRIDEVEFHPAYHQLMALGIEKGIPSLPWTAEQPGGHVVHAAQIYLFTQAEAGVCCPFAMAYAAVPTLRREPEIAAEWVPRLLTREYDPRSIPAAEKRGCTVGMAMTEKQGGSDVRANTTRATPVAAPGTGREYVLHGHKWFCSAPMSDAFLTLARTANGLSCFLVPRWLPDGTRNRIYIQRLKDKLGNRSNASAEIEFQDTRGRMIGEDGASVRAIIDMVQHTRLDAAASGAGLMRAAFAQAAHHAARRRAFGKILVEQALMRNVLADLALESEAATALFLRTARAFDEAPQDPIAAAFARIATAAAKYWINKRAPYVIYEAMECLGGGGYVEESVLPRLYREAPLNSIWEGAGNVIALDVLRAIEREAACADALVQELETARGADSRFDRAFERLKQMLAVGSRQEQAGRRLAEQIALTLQGALLLRYAPAAVADPFCGARLGGEGGIAYGTLPPHIDCKAIIERAWPEFT